MDLESAIKTALEFETKVTETYRRAEAQAIDPTAKKVFGVLCREEQGHVDYLQSRLEEWRRTGHVTPGKLETAVPARDRITAGMKRLSARPKAKAGHGGGELDLLQTALKNEQETSAFYQRMVAELPAEGQALFARFLEIEQGHVAIVQAEIDAVSGLGFWFDMQEFELEGG